MADLLPKNLLDQRLPDWYRAVSIDLDGELITARKAAIQSLAKDIGPEDAPQVVAYAHGRRQHGDELIEWIREAAREHDAAFAAEAKDLEPQVMMACAVAHRLASDPQDNVSTALSLLVESAAFRGFPSAVRGQDLPALAQRQLRAAADTTRKPAARSSPTMQKRISDSFAELGDWPTDGGMVTNTQLQPWLEAVRSSLDSAARRLDTVERTVVRYAGVTREQLDQTAWLLDDYCELAGKPWGAVGQAVATLLAATELAAITRPPGSSEVTVMLKSTLVKAGADPNASADALEAVRRAARLLKEWPRNPDHELAPLTSAVAAWRRMKGQTGWRELAKTNRHGGAMPHVKAFALAEQAFRELHLAKLLSNA